MLVKFFRRDSLDVLVVFILILLAIWFKSLVGIGEVDPEHNIAYGTPFELLINQFTENFPQLSAYSGFLVSVVVLLMMNSLNNRFIFVPQRSLYPSLLYVIIGFSFLSLQHLTPALVAMPLIILSLQSIFESYRKDYAEGEYFKAGFFLAIASIIYLPALAYTITIIFSILIMRPFSWREWVSTAGGLVVPAVFLIAFYLIFDKETFQIIMNIDPSKIIAAIPKHMNSFFGYGFYFIITVSFVVAFLFILGWSGTQKVRTNKIFMVFLSMIVVAVFSYLLIPTVSKDVLVIAALPLSYIISTHFIFSRRTFLPDAFTLAILLISMLLQIFME